ncbi:MAG: bifunctional adenosylcobinamide kinase/adenosylcobinamide-phosphate guanylyltransferase [Candidatus Lambdaproteobacteria bacterium RIFOXYD2_FULL_50_16]|uniref:Bifunctional adenosylcobalamin biosynthesis protein n=1 Tax=Candidatus Lambdaproteobacteria bacterium RIFOXYD2_FULL_50_16 TaxID=1817772 RepID=A0A1F6GB09_9PROT|nr:MAG: bifunctional adenosylcobinamide kinase/adenosylcobinamide-phosphate guanylyltransferase [Candidatus Lambdaproteobacteria bacterium RIFOXYD2_FULL_50_16]
MKPLVTLLTGGARSGKSQKALELAQKAKHPLFVATGQAFDAEMKDRIARHQRERGPQFGLVEEPTELAQVLQRLPQNTDLVLIDCLTLWLNNLIYQEGEQERYPQVEALLLILKKPPCPVILVTNELGLGMVPENPLARRFRDLQGRLNQEVAALADQVLMMVSGLPIFLKSVD